MEKKDSLNLLSGYDQVRVLVHGFSLTRYFSLLCA